MRQHVVRASDANQKHSNRGLDLERNGDGRFCVKDVRCLLDDVFLPKAEVSTRWIKSIPIKINIFAWKLCLDRLSTRVNLAKRNVAVATLLCPLCDSGMEDAAHLLFRCDMAKDVMFLVLSTVLFEGGAESHQLSLLTNLLDTAILSNMEDRWFFDLNGDGRFCVKDVRCLLDDVFLPKAEFPAE
nr:RNA-directed DNA polymerase, eukaryota [Tanacetum cinerariifolium]